jgi:hypothetical protein
VRKAAKLALAAGQSPAKLLAETDTSTSADRPF